MDVADEDFSADANLHSLKQYAGYAAFWSAALARGNVKGYVGKVQISPQEARQQVKRRLLGLRADKVLNLYRKGKALLSDPFLRGWRSALFDKRHRGIPNLVDEAPEAAMTLAECRLPAQWNWPHGWNEKEGRNPLILEGYVHWGFACGKGLHEVGYPGYDDARGWLYCDIPRNGV